MSMVGLTDKIFEVLMISGIQQIINAWSIDFYAGWSIMDIFRVMLILTVLSMVFNYFFDSAKHV